MTTIVFRDGILAADTRAYSGGAMQIGHKVKIHQTKWDDGSVHTFGVSTAHPGLSEELSRWLESGCNPDCEPNLNGREFDILEIVGENEVYFYHDTLQPTGPLEAPYFAIGSGSYYALGALTMGASAPEAVGVAAELDVWTGAPIMTIETTINEGDKNG